MFVTLMDSRFLHFGRKPYKDIFSICFPVCLFKCWTWLQIFCWKIWSAEVNICFVIVQVHFWMFIWKIFFHPLVFHECLGICKLSLIVIHRDCCGVFPCGLQQLWKPEKYFSCILCDLILAGVVFSLGRHTGCLPGLLVTFCLPCHREPWLSLLHSELEEAAAFFLLFSTAPWELCLNSAF